MIRQDYLIAQLEELAKKIARLLRKKADSPTDEIDKAADDCYSFFNLNIDQVRNATAEDLIESIQDWSLLELLVKLILLDDRLITERDQMEKAKVILYYVQELDRTYSLERISLSEELEARLRS